MQTIKKHRRLLAAYLVAFSVTVFAHPASAQFSIETAAAEADLIFKGTAVSSEQCKDDWFKQVDRLGIYETKLKVISVIKGDAHGDVVRFHHYSNAKPERIMGWVSLYDITQFQYFTEGQTYIVFAKKSDQPEVWRQPWLQGNLFSYNGFIRCADSEAVSAKTVRDAIWSELLGMLKSKREEDALFAIQYLDIMSRPGSGPYQSGDFSRKAVTDALAARMTPGETEVTKQAIWLIAPGHPYYGRPEDWLKTVGKSAVITLNGRYRKEMPQGKSHWKELVSIANSKGDSEMRAYAIRSLGLTRQPELKEAIARWITDKEPEVRASAALLLADYPGEESDKKLKALARDPDGEVRVCVANAVGFAQNVKLAGLLQKLMQNDEDSWTRDAAARSLLSFSAKDKTIAALLRANLDNEEYKPLFLNALAAENPQPYLDALASAAVNIPGARIPGSVDECSGTAWKILFKYIKDQPPDKVRSGKLDRYLDVIEKNYSRSSSWAPYIYAFYLQRGMGQRAKEFREATNKSARYDMEPEFQKVDLNPEAYAR